MSPDAQVDFAELDKLLEEAVNEMVKSKKEEKEDKKKEEEIVEEKPVQEQQAQPSQVSPPQPPSQPQAVDFAQLDKMLESAVKEMTSEKTPEPPKKEVKEAEEKPVQKAEIPQQTTAPQPPTPPPTPPSQGVDFAQLEKMLDEAVKEMQEGGGKTGEEKKESGTKGDKVAEVEESKKAIPTVKEEVTKPPVVVEKPVQEQQAQPSQVPSFQPSTPSQSVDFSQLEKMLDEAVKEMSGGGGEEKKESGTKGEAEKVVPGAKKPEESEGKEEKEGEERLFNEEIGAGIVKYTIKGEEREFIKTGVPGFDDLFTHGIPKGNAVIVAGGAGSGKTILCLQICYNLARAGIKTLFMSFEERPKRLIEHMKDFGMDPEPLIKKNLFRIEQYNAFDMSRSIEALLAKQRGELLIDIDPVILPENFVPDVVIVDSLSAIGSAFMGRMENYRIYIEQLFRFFEKLGVTSFLITETEPMPTRFSITGAEEFLADGVIVLYHLRKKDIRENAIEVLKMRGEKHVKKIVPMEITDTGIIIYPQQEAFGMKEFF